MSNQGSETVAAVRTSRLMLFNAFMKGLTTRAKDKGIRVGFAERAGAGLAAGGLATFIGNPADLALSGMQTDDMEPVEHRKSY
ncbi:hypothetical protein DL770_007405 [Monosporascus sp. CRB-9-2]|nr:hypothetical protein DL770_007405 [Monosporascus sp. CRB-9-2]